jgi:amino acid transporter
MLQMIGIGPFITLPILLAAMPGPQALLGWFVAGLISMADGLVWAELGAAMPGEGGPYHYLKQAYGPNRFGKLMAFVYIWETVLSAPLSIAGGAVGVSLYLKFYWPTMSLSSQRMVAIAVCLVCTFLLYREIRSVGWLSVAMWVVVMFTLGWVVVSGLLHFQTARVLDFPPNAFDFSRHWFLGLGAATLIAMYNYGGYSNVCLFGGEVNDPGRTIPKSIIYAVLVVGIFYIMMSVTIIGVVPWKEAMASPYIISEFIQRTYGGGAAFLMTALILWTGVASVFATMLGYSRVPYAAAVDGQFFQVFARVHPTKHFPTFSLLFLGVTTALACLFSLDALIRSLLVIQIVTQYIAQVVAVTMIRHYRKDIVRPFRMWLYPLPSLLALVGWTWMLLGSGWPYVALAFGILALGIGGYLLQAKERHDWPFAVESVPA